jgi:hypothetical protein
MVKRSYPRVFQRQRKALRGRWEDKGADVEDGIWLGDERMTICLGGRCGVACGLGPVDWDGVAV